MAKLKLNPGRGPISKKVISSAQKALKRKIIDISELRKAKIRAEDLEKTIISEEGLSEYDPLHAVYIYGQNKISVFIEQIAELPGLSKLTNAYVHAEDLYMPSGPPMSPLTKSYFTCWGFFDLCVGIKKETFGTVIIDLCRYLKVDPGLIKIFECMQNSRMGFYVHEGLFGKFIKLRELITEKMRSLAITGDEDQIIQQIENLGKAGITQMNIGPPLGPNPREAIERTKRIIAYFSSA